MPEYFSGYNVQNDEAHAPNPFGQVRIPPHQIEAEISVLGALLLDTQAIFRIADMLQPQDFYRHQHQRIFEAMLDLFVKNEPIDVLSVAARLEEKKFLEQSGGKGYLAELVNSVPTSSNVTHYASLVRKKKVLRDLIEAAGAIGELGYQENAPVEELLDNAEQRVFRISQRSLSRNFVPVRGELERAWERIEQRHSDGTPGGIATKFRDLDMLLAGLHPSDLIVLAARPSLGKTSLALDIARHAAVLQSVPVGIFSLEMSTQQVVDRLIASQARVSLWKLRTGRNFSKNQEEFVRIREALEQLAKAPIFIDDTVSNTALQMRALARRLQAEHGLGLIIVDYIQIMQAHVPTESMVQQITEISRSLKGLARELNVPVLALSQLSRAVEQRGGKPRLSDLRDSGSIEQDADVVMFIHREDRRKEDSARKNQADILVAKHRNGPLGQITLYFNEECVSFTDFSDSGGYDTLEY